MKLKHIIILLFTLISCVLSASQKQINLNEVRDKSFSRSSAKEQSKIDIRSDRATGGLLNSSASIVMLSNAQIVVVDGNYQSSGDADVTGTGTITLGGDFVNSNSSGNPLSSGITLVCNGSAEQQLPDGTVETVEVNNGAGATLTADLTIGETLTLTSGNLNLNGQNLILDADASLVETGGVVYGTGSISTIRSLNGINGTLPD
ncbi:MAG: hypothetical protein PHR06_12435 [Candidatus Cloacimonetes bacterium]|nr:hypothetical protein [Candidatus Cloacimonadota bacterium]